MGIDFFQIALKRDIGYLIQKETGFLNTIIVFAVVAFAVSVLSFIIGTIAQVWGFAMFGSTGANVLVALIGLGIGLGFALLLLLIPILIIAALIILLGYFSVQFVIAKALGGQTGFSTFFNKMLYLLTSIYVLFWLIALPFQFIIQMLALGAKEPTIMIVVSGLGIIILLINLIQVVYSIYLQTVLTQRLMNISTTKAFIAVVIPIVAIALILVITILPIVLLRIAPITL